MWVSKSWLLIWVILWGPEGERKEEPMFFLLGNEWNQVKTKEVAFQFDGKDSLATHTMEVLRDSIGFPILFFSDIKTPVCADGKCQLARLKIYWDLLGDYAGFAIDPTNPLTKYDHDPFDKKDYQKLHRLLSDQYSILQRKKMEDLVVKKKIEATKETSKFVDGVTSATKAEIKEAVVEGGLYSCFTLWHLVHGQVSGKIANFTQTFNQDTLNTYFLYSDYGNYQTHALKQLSKREFEIHQQQIHAIFQGSKPITRSYILKKMPPEVLTDSVMAVKYFGLLPDIDINSRTRLIRMLQVSHPIAIQVTSKYVRQMSQNQLKYFLVYLEQSSVHFSSQIESNLKKVIQDGNYAYGYLIEDFLNSR
jgi:hypothetical protein